MKISDGQKRILEAYVGIVKQENRLPLPSELLGLGVTRHQIRHAFSSMAGLRVTAKKLYPKAFERVVDESLFTPKNFAKLKSEVKPIKRFVITTAVTGCKVDEEFLASIDGYCKYHDAMLLILVATDPAAKAGWQLDPILGGRNIVFNDLALNKNLFLSSIKLSAKHIDPITSLGRIGQRNGSFIYASPKQRLKMVPTAKTRHPVAIMTTGALTDPAYQSERYMSDRTAYIAEHDHVKGAIVVEVEGDRSFHFRQVQSDRDGAFVDLGIMYEGKFRDEYRPDAQVWGDLHVTETDPDARRGNLDLADLTSPKRFVIHDGFSGLSINHHDRKKIITQGMLASKKKLCLLDELTAFASEIDFLSDRCDEVDIVKSNHDEFLERYLEDGIFIKDPQNLRLSLTLAAAMHDGEDPLRFAVETVIGLKSPKKVRWLKRDEDFKVAGIELGAHGDLGANGGPGSINSIESTYGNAVVGHTHSAEILRGVWRAGTTSLMDLKYNRGASGWTHSSVQVYPNGMRQMIFFFKGKFQA